MIMDPRNQLRTPRLLLTAPRVTDIPRIATLANDPDVAKMTLNIPHPYTEMDAVFWLNMAREGRAGGHHYIFAIRDPEAEEFLGGVGITVNELHQRGTLGYWLGQPYWGQGITTEAVAALIAMGFEELKLHRIDATHLVTNPASGRVMEKNGMKKEALLEDYFIRKGRISSVYQYRILRREWAAEK
ncbi:GNAT family N-acetyltransferase [Lewinella sp. W8]|nr:GNAT family N-acetyltransferase [Lewinella sp. W8]